jgi:hypothetical protein
MTLIIILIVAFVFGIYTHFKNAEEKRQKRDAYWHKEYERIQNEQCSEMNEY